jgi:hypothetical protein
MGDEVGDFIIHVQNFVEEVLHKEREEMYYQFTKLIRCFTFAKYHHCNANHGVNAI